MSAQLHGKVYKITSPNTDKIYIGSTIRTLQQRMSKHMADYKNRTHTSKFVIDHGDADIELIEDFKCDSLDDLHRREGEFIKQYIDTCVNDRIAGRTQQEYREENKDKIAERYKQYRDLHRDEISEKARQYREENYDVLCDKKKQYRESHRSDLNEKAKQYYQQNKEKILEKIKEKVKCHCGLEVVKNHLKRHQNAGLHKRLLLALGEEVESD